MKEMIIMYETTITIFKKDNKPLISADFVSPYLEQALQETGIDYYDEEPQCPNNMLREFYNIKKNFVYILEEHSHCHERMVRTEEKMRYANYTEMIKYNAYEDDSREELYNIIKDIGKIEVIKSTLFLFREEKDFDNFYLKVDRKYGAV